MRKQITIDKRTAGLVVAFVLVFMGGFSLGRERGGTEESGKPASLDFSLFWDAWRIAEEKYMKSVDDKERLYGAIAGQIASLGDPYSAFLKPEESSRFTEDLNGNFEGIGAELIQKDGLITVVAPLDGSPAQKAGIQAGDIIVKIDDKDAPTPLSESVKLIRGPKGTQVKLGLVRGEKTLELTITRDTVVIKSVNYTLRDKVAIIKLNQFTGNTTQLLDEALAQAKKDKVRSIVVDVRNNPGGLLNVSVDVASRFIEPGVVVVEKDKQGKETELRTTEVRERTTTPMVIIVNKGSASASEIVAGALQDTGRARVVGETTFGKGSVQSIESLKDGSSIRITIAEWLTPKKRQINEVGIKPDVEVALTEEDTAAGRDPQLDKALELLK